MPYSPTTRSKYPSPVTSVISGVLQNIKGKKISKNGEKRKKSRLHQVRDIRDIE